MKFSENYEYTETKSIELKIKILVEQLNQHNKEYYIDNHPVISDAEYDRLFKELQALEIAYPHFIQSNSPTQNVANSALDERFKPVNHIQPMLSLNNALDSIELKNFVQQCSKLTHIDASKLIFNCEPKFDGLALSLHYHKGKLICAATRGDGRVGENVTHNVHTMQCIPKYLHNIGDNNTNAPEFVEIRGEVLIFNKDFISLNQAQAKRGKRIYVNARNAAAGSLRQLNAEDTANVPLSFFAYGIGDIQAKNISLDSQSKIMQQLIKWGMPVAQQYIQIVEGIEELEQYYTYMQSQREGLDFDIDGIVYKIDDIELQQKMGYVAKAPRFAIAHKFPPRHAITTIEAIDVQVGRTGAITPVARLKPVQVSGVTISNATLHNEDEIKRKGIGVGDEVYVRRAADVIPEVFSLHKKADIAQTFMMPTHCPECNSIIVKLATETIARCSGQAICPAQIKGTIEHFASRKAMNIDGLGEKLVAQLVDCKYIYSVKDIFTLSNAQLIKLERMAIKSADNLIQSIQNIKHNVSLAKFIYALGIRHVGETTAKDLAKSFKTFNDLRQASLENLLCVHDVGEVVANSILLYFKSTPAIWFDELLAHIEFEKHINNITENNKQQHVFYGKTLVITGTFAKHSRDELIKILEALGAKISNSVSKKTHALICGNDSGGKLEKAQALNIEIIDEEALQIFIS